MMSQLHPVPVLSRERAIESEESFDAFGDLLQELEGIGRRAHEARVKLALGEATTGVTALIDIENRCRDAIRGGGREHGDTLDG
jgi:hypothetical protein